MKILSVDVDWLQPGSRYHLKELNRLFFAKCAKAKQIVFGRYHHQVLQIPEVLDSNEIILHNIDHHHDFFYEEWQEQQISQGIATHAVWIGNLIHDRKVSECYWYYNINSDLIRPENFIAQCMDQRIPNVKFAIEENLDEAWKLDYDLIFVARSAETLDSSLFCVYDTYVDYCQEKYNSKTTIARIYPDLPNTPINIRQPSPHTLERKFKILNKS